MNDRENALRAIRFDQPERITLGAPGHWMGYRGCNHEGYIGGGHDSPVGASWTDVWGTVWHRELPGVMGFPRVHPLADFPAAMAAYEWPDPNDERICGCIPEQAKGWNRDAQFLTGSHRETLWEKAHMMVGMETLMCALYTEPQAVRDLLHRIMDFQLVIAGHYLSQGAEMASLSDDLGTQNGPLLSPQCLEEFFLPEYRRLFSLYKEHGVLISMHSCGNISDLVEMFIDLGVDVLNPVQASANDLDRVRRITQGRMALQGGVSSNRIVQGPIEAIRREAAERIWQLGRGGGYFCGPDQGMPWPDEHYKALVEAVGEFGRYPLRRPEEWFVAAGKA